MRTTKRVCATAKKREKEGMKIIRCWGRGKSRVGACVNRQRILMSLTHF